MKIIEKIENIKYNNKKLYSQDEYTIKQTNKLWYIFLNLTEQQKPKNSIKKTQKKTNKQTNKQSYK